MRIRKTFSLYFASVSLISALLIGTAFLFFVDDVEWYEILLKKTFFWIPSGIFLVVLCIVLGVVTGWIIGGTIQKKNDDLAAGLFEIEQGNYEIQIEKQKQDDEFSIIWQRLETIASRLKEQAIVQQRFTSERVEWNQQLKEEVLTKERNRLARELHDSVSQQLFAATMLLSAINQNPDPASETALKQLKLVEGIVNEAQTEMRALLLHLRPVQLDGKSLKAGIEEVLSEVTAKIPIKVIWNIQDVHLEKGVEDHLFRIVQEAVSNTLRHAKATVLEVSLKQIHPFVYLKITDNGKGFDTSNNHVGSYGLSNMKERTAEIGGNLKMISIKDNGTSIEIKVPILI
ncbi:sensor histidine kinase [Bacillus niameyensis]|uniref:sensor histidine kinase n=1 Tax=Bacillus niameyensis TaxID=1522308 RepID=UPI000780DF7B|nr:sensor histidine kinase [Bacillus niameyensis]